MFPLRKTCQLKQDGIKNAMESKRLDRRWNGWNAWNGMKKVWIGGGMDGMHGMGWNLKCLEWHGWKWNELECMEWRLSELECMEWRLSELECTE